MGNNKDFIEGAAINRSMAVQNTRCSDKRLIQWADRRSDRLNLESQPGNVHQIADGKPGSTLWPSEAYKHAMTRRME